MSTFKELLAQIQGNRTNAEMASLLSISNGHYSNIRHFWKAENDAEARKTKRPSREFIDRLVTVFQLSQGVRKQLLVAAGYPTDNLDPAAYEFDARISDDRLSPEQRDLVVHNALAFLDCWQHYFTAKRLQYNRRWNDATKECNDGLAQITNVSNRLAVYLSDTLAAVKLHLSDLDGVADRHIEIEKRVAALIAIDNSVYSDQFIRALNAMHRGDYYREVSNWAQAEAQYQAASNIFQKLNRDAERARCERKLAIIKLYQGEWLHARNLLDDCRGRFVELQRTNHPDAKYEIAKTDYTLGWSYNLEGNWEEAHLAHQRGYEYSKQHRTKDGSTDEYMIMLGVSYLANDARQIQDYNTAEELYYKAERLAYALSDERALGWIYLGLARVNERKAKAANLGLDADILTKQAAEYYAKAIQILVRQHQYRYRYAMTIIHFAHFEIWRKNYAEAEKRLIESLQITREMSIHYYEAEALAFLCQLYALNVDHYPSLARTAARVALLHELYGYDNHMARVRFSEAQAAAAVGKRSEAAKYVAQALDHALKFHQTLVNDIIDRIGELLQAAHTKQKPIQQRIDGYVLLNDIIDACHEQEATIPVYTLQDHERWKDSIARIKKFSSRYRV